MLQRSVEVSPWDALALIAPDAALHRHGKRKAMLQVVGSGLVGWHDEVGLVAVVGLYSLPHGGAEVWLAGHADRTRPHLRQIARETRLTLAALAQSGIQPILAHVHRSHAPGRRLALLVGMSRVFGETSAAPDFDCYMFGGP